MTRRSKRELERAVENLDADPDADDGGPYGPGLVYETDAGGYVDLDGEPVPTDDDGAPLPPRFGPTVIFSGYCRNPPGHGDRPPDGVSLKGEDVDQ